MAKAPGPKLTLQQFCKELNAGASAMKISLVQVSPSKKNASASHGVGEGVIGLSVGSGVTGSSVGKGDGTGVGSL